MRTLIPLVVFCAAGLCQSNPPPPTPAIKRDQPKQPATEAQKQSRSDERGTEESPIVVKVLPPAKTQHETADDKGTGLDKSSPDWWMVWLTGAIVFLGLIQTIVFSVQARRLKQTIKKMDEIASSQTRDVQASIAEATRAAQAMEGIASSMAENVKSVDQSVAINREIGERQRLISELQSRAYLAVEFEGMVPQNATVGTRFEPKWRLVNRGITPAKNIRFAAFADVVVSPLATDITFPVSTELGGYSSAIGPGLHKIISAIVPKMYEEDESARIALGQGKIVAGWGVVNYEDMFGIKRYVRFALVHFRASETQWMSQDVANHNDSD